MDEGPSLIEEGPAPPVPAAPARPDVPGVTWRWWEAVVVFVIAAVLGGVLGAPFAAILDSKKLQFVAFVLASEVGLGATTVVWLYALHRQSFRAIGFPVRPGVEIGAGVLGGLAVWAIGVFVIGSIVAAIIHAFSHETVRSPHQLPQHLSGTAIALSAIGVLVAAPIAEELFFRGFLFRSIRARHGFVLSGVVSAVCFGAVHFQGRWQNGLLLAVVMCFVGFGLAWIYERRGNVVANMAAHATFNVIGFAFIVALLR